MCLTRLLEATKNESVVRSQDVFTVVRYVSYNPLGQSMAWDWTTLNWDYLVNRSVKNVALPPANNHSLTHQASSHQNKLDFSRIAEMHYLLFSFKSIRIFSCKMTLTSLQLTSNHPRYYISTL